MFAGAKDSMYWRNSWGEAGIVGTASLAEFRKQSETHMIELANQLCANMVLGR
jgi:hypothetical protein